MINACSIAIASLITRSLGIASPSALASFDFSDTLDDCNQILVYSGSLAYNGFASHDAQSGTDPLGQSVSLEFIRLLLCRNLGPGTPIAFYAGIASMLNNNPLVLPGSFCLQVASTEPYIVASGEVVTASGNGTAGTAPSSYEIIVIGKGL